MSIKKSKDLDKLPLDAKFLSYIRKGIKVFKPPGIYKMLEASRDLYSDYYYS